MRQLIDRPDHRPSLRCREPARTRGPDFTQPLRMQARGRDAAASHRLRVTRLLWMRAIRDRSVWRRAGWLGLAAGAVQIAIYQSGHAGLSETGGIQALRLAGMLAVCLAVGVVAVAGTQVRTQAMRMVCGRN